MDKLQDKKPIIRFPKFDDVWEHSKLSDLLVESKKRNTNLKFGKDKVLSVSGESGVVNQIRHLGRSYAGESVHNYHVVDHGDIVYTKSPLKANPYGIIKLNKGDAGIVSTLYAVYKVKEENAYGPFLDYYFSLDTNTNRYLRPLVKKGAKNDMKINNDYVLHDRIFVPSVGEQKKIASFFDALDNRIKNLDQSVACLSKYKKGVTQNLFSQKIRLKDLNGKIFPKWDEKVLGDVIVEYSDKNNGKLSEVVSVGKYGIRKRNEIYSKELTGDISNYKVITKNTLVIGMGSSQIDIGILLEDRTLAVSPAYSTFKIVRAESSFLKELLIHLNRKLSVLYMITGARQGKSINKKDFLRHKLHLPSTGEQKRIADFLSAINQLVESRQQQVNHLKQWKRGLMQKMFA